MPDRRSPRPFLAVAFCALLTLVAVALAAQPPAQALMTASHGAADLLGVADVTGSLEAGKAADVVAVPGNPFQDITATERPVLVMKGGEIVVRGAR